MMDDLIRRSDAIKAMAKAVGHIVHDAEAVSQHVMNSIPAVEPCKDAVSREWLLNELEEMNVANFYEANFHSNEMYGQMKRMLKAAPSVTVEPKQGEWKGIDKLPDMAGYKWYRCTYCDYLSDKVVNFCPHCGAKMKGANDEIADT